MQVVMNDQNSVDPSAWSHAFERGISILACAFSPHITVFKSTLTKKPGQPFPYERSFYRWNENSQWVLVESCWTRQRVIPPRLSVKGIVGEYMRLKGGLFDDFANKQNALTSIYIEVFQKHNFGGEQPIPFRCLHDNCFKEFKEFGGYISHLSRDQSHEAELGIEGQELLLLLPTDIKESLTVMALELLEDWRWYKNGWAQMEEAWGTPDSEKRRRYTEYFLGQLKNDPVLYHSKCGNDLTRHPIWYGLQQKWTQIDRANEIISKQKSLNG
jgi:hypothetical protein